MLNWDPNWGLTQSPRTHLPQAPTLRGDRLNSLDWGRHQHKELLFPSDFYKAFTDPGRPQDNPRLMGPAARTMRAKRQAARVGRTEGHSLAVQGSGPPLPCNRAAQAWGVPTSTDQPATQHRNPTPGAGVVPHPASLNRAPVVTKPSGQSL